MIRWFLAVAVSSSGLGATLELYLAHGGAGYLAGALGCGVLLIFSSIRLWEADQRS